VNLFELFVKIGVDDQASGKLKDLGGKLGNGLKTAAKIGTAAVGAAAAGITALTTAAVNNYAEYEQLVGGVDTLFKDASKKVQQYAADAYKTAGMSANDYMANATAFSASLISSLGGDTEKAAEYANRAMVSMSDNANKMGTSLDSIVQTYQSLSRGNMAMLDNLKLGYGGTKAELERLIADAASYTDIQKEMGVTVDASSMSFDNIVNAIAVVQGKLGIAGATAAEAGTTIEGSVNSMKAAWDNLITGVANKNADLEGLINNLVTSIVGDGTEENLGVLGNIMPAVKQALNGASKLVQGLLPKIVQEIPSIINDNLPILAEAAISIVQALVDGISENQEMLMKTAMETITYLATSLISMLPQIVKLGLDLIVSLANGIADSLPELIPTIMEVVLQIVDTLTSPENLTNLLNAALTIITELAYGLMDAIPQLVDACFTIIENLVDFLIDPTNIGMLLKAALDIIIAIGTGLISSIPRLIEYWKKVPKSIIDNFKETDWGKLGNDLVDGFKNGISKAWTNLKKWFKDLFGDLIGIAKKILGIASPSKVFKKIGGFTAEGFGVGFEDEFAHVKDDMEDALKFDDASVGINASIRKVGAGVAGGAFGGTSIGNININIDGAKYTDEQSLASAIALEIQNMTDRRAAVYA
jgi:hypothetical protein